MTNILIGLLDFLSMILNGLPSFSGAGTSEIGNAVLYMVKFISFANYLIPVDTILQVTMIVVGYKLTMMGIWLVNWVIHVIRG
ncbi:hypothetical protein D3C81_1835560 [compost metagenome]